ncbi:MAG TPA: YajG family lipoprotein, partial [Desulfopila sp.]|nr:YajG family lipoprotein [Desulfopila sp.]
RVNRAKMVHHTTVVSRVNLRLEHNGRTLGKKYNHESNRESLDRPEVEELEELLETQLSDIVGQILTDEAIRDFIKQQ